MKLFVPIITMSLVLFAYATSKQQHTSATESLPVLSYQQMLEDYDTLVSYIRQISPIIYYNKEVRGIDFELHAKKLRDQINSKTTTAAFIQIVEKTLNAAQDGHTSRVGSWQLDIMKKYWLPAEVSFVRGIDSTSTENAYTYASYLRKEIYTKLDLNLVYTSGAYYNLLPFSYKGKNYPASMELISCNGVKIHDYVGTLTELVSPLRWDRANNRVYEETFYSHIENYKNDVIKFVFRDQYKKEHQLSIAKNDTVTFLQEKTGSYSYNSDTDTIITHYFEKQGIFYARLPMMVEEFGDSVKQRLEAISQENTIHAVVVDIRGNGGGSDNTYGNFLKKIVQDTLKLDIVIGRNFSPYNQDYFEINRDSVENRESNTFNVAVPTLKEPEMYYIQQSYNFVVPDSNPLPFHGKIYVLQDRYIYSSASNLSTLAKNSDQLISIGQTPDLLGGFQTNPVVMMLPHSKVIFRVEPQIDLTNITTVSDMFQNNVEYPVPYSIEDVYIRSTNKENIYGKEFLLNQDPMIKKVLELEQQKGEK